MQSEVVAATPDHRGMGVMENQLDKPAELSVAQLQLIESRVANERKSVGLAYVLWFILGLWGIHNFYLGKPGMAVFQIAGGVFGIVLILIAAAGPTPLGIIGILVLIAWVLSFFIDLFLIPGRAKAYSDHLRRKYEAELLFRSA
jgi:TM2 domain-containing membrane protein YozV